jgi:hypothetical protein
MTQSGHITSWLDLDWTSTPQALVSIGGVRADPLRAAASTCCPSLADPKGYMSCTRSGAHYDKSITVSGRLHSLQCAMLLSSVIVASLPSLRGVVAAGNIGERRLVTWQKQALHGEVSSRTRSVTPFATRSISLCPMATLSSLVYVHSAGIDCRRKH